MLNITFFLKNQYTNEQHIKTTYIQFSQTLVNVHSRPLLVINRKRLRSASVIDGGEPEGLRDGIKSAQSGRSTNM